MTDHKSAAHHVFMYIIYLRVYVLYSRWALWRVERETLHMGYSGFSRLVHLYPPLL